jgi:hypothetical protein
MDREWLRERLDEGLSLEEIGRLAQRHPSTVSYWLLKYGFRASGRDRHRPRGSIDRERLATLLAADLSVREIAELLDRSPATVRYWLRRYGLATTAVARTKRWTRSGGHRRVAGTCPTHGAVDMLLSPEGRTTCLRCRAESVSEWRRRAKRILVAEAGGRCRICGYDRSVAALHFHHLDPAQKRFGLGSRGLARSIASLRKEARKCVLLCSNCHAEVEAGLATLP